MIVDIVRLETSFESGTFGVMLIDGMLAYTTIEPPVYGNQKSHSCIPEGQYESRRIICPSFGETFMVANVPNRTNILIHKGNTKNETEGCIIIGQYPGKLRHQRAVMNSGKSFDEFMFRLAGNNSFRLCIKSIW